MTAAAGNELTGCRVRLVSIQDPRARVQPGTTGTVAIVDGFGTVHVTWDDGSMLGLVPGVDEWEVIDGE